LFFYPKADTSILHIAHCARTAKPAALLPQGLELAEARSVERGSSLYTDAIFGIFYLLGFQFSPRIADAGGARLWRIDPAADYRVLKSRATRDNFLAPFSMELYYHMMI
jgi:hypothetical protein